MFNIEIVTVSKYSKNVTSVIRGESITDEVNSLEKLACMSKRLIMRV